MPQMSTIISGAASLGVLAGVVSGIFYLVLTGIRWAGRIRAALQEDQRRAKDQCVSCGRSMGGTEVRPVDCTVCGRRCCYGAPCSRPAPIGWTCILCHVKREMESSSGNWTDVKSEEETSRKITPSTIDKTTFPIRELIEKLVEKIVGAPLDSVTVGRLSNHQSYHSMFSNYHGALCEAITRLGLAIQVSMSSNGTNKEESLSGAHSVLNQIIEKIAREANSLPNLTKCTNQTVNTEDYSDVTSNGSANKSYEDILSTAILNQVIEKYQRENGYISRSKEKKYKARGHDSYDLVDGNDSDWSNESGKPLSLKIEEQIEEVTTAYESSSEELIEEEEELPLQTKRVPFPEFGVDIVEGSEAIGTSDSESDSCATDVISTQSTWEENWLFQRKKLRSPRNSHHPVPVPMLVPNPSQDFRALIGGRDADDISDLSECSDSVLEEAFSETTEDPNKVIQMMEELNRDPVDETADLLNVGSEETTSEPSSNEVTTMECEILNSTEQNTTTQVDNQELDEPSPSVSPFPSLMQQDRDIPVDYDAVPQIGRPPLPRPRSLDVVPSEFKLDESDEEEEKPPLCPIAEREKAKWNNAIEMKDNPYTPENIAKRMKKRDLLYSARSRSTDAVEFPDELAQIDEPMAPQRKYSRDYYIKASRSPTGEVLSRLADSPVSFRSETSLEEESRHKLEIWEDMDVVLRTSPNSQNYVATVTYRESGLPNVKELRKSFQGADNVVTKPPKPVPAIRRNRSSSLRIRDDLQKESENKLSNNTESSKVEGGKDKNHKEFPQDDNRSTGETPMSAANVVDSSQHNGKHPLNRNSSQEDHNTENEEDIGKLPILGRSRKPIKPVHSLTARSIPKDFREGLKKNSQVNKSLKTGVTGEIYSANDMKHNNTPLQIDLKEKKQFWESIIAKSKQ